MVVDLIKTHNLSIPDRRLFVDVNTAALKTVQEKGRGWNLFQGNGVLTRDNLRMVYNAGGSPAAFRMGIAPTLETRWEAAYGRLTYNGVAPINFSLLFSIDTQPIFRTDLLGNLFFNQPVDVNNPFNFGWNTVNQVPAYPASRKPFGSDPKLRFSNTYYELRAIDDVPADAEITFTLFIKEYSGKELTLDGLEPSA